MITRRYDWHLADNAEVPHATVDEVVDGEVNPFITLTPTENITLEKCGILAENFSRLLNELEHIGSPQ